MTGVVLLLLWTAAILKPHLLTLAFVHHEVHEADTVTKPYWPVSTLSQVTLTNETLKFGSLDLPRFFDEFSTDGRTTCGEILTENVLIYKELRENISSGDLTVLSSRELDIVSLLNSWGSDLKYALWTLDHWNWISNDMQCKLSRYHWRKGTMRTQYCAYETETGDDVKKDLVLGYCIPDSCTKEEASVIGDKLALSVQPYWRMHAQNVTKSSITCSTSYQTVPWYRRPQSWAVVIILVIALLMTVISWIMQMRCPDDNANIFVNIFSIQRNVKQLCRVHDQTVSCMDGLKTLTTIFCIVCHVTLIIQAFSTDLKEMREAFRGNFLLAIMYNGPYLVGTFFLVGATSQVFMLLSKYEKTKEKRFSPLFWICVIVNRYLRLLPLLIFTTVFVAELLTYANFPLWTYIDAAVRCPPDYWRHLLLVQNLQSVNLCLPWTWYVAVDFQLFLLNLPLVCLIQHKPKLGLSLVGVCLIISCVIKGWLIRYYDYPPNIMLIVPFTNYNDNLTHYSFQIYMRPQNWWSAYLAGLLTGYLLHKYGKRRVLPSITYWITSFTATVFIVWAVFGIHPSANGFKNGVYDALYSALLTAAWACGWAWVIIACYTSTRAKYVNYILSCRPMVFLSSLTYACYLIHIPIAFGITFAYSIWFGGKPRIRFQPLEIAILCTSTVIISYVIAFLMYLLIEAPADQIRGILMRMAMTKMKRRRNEERMHDDEQRGRIQDRELLDVCSKRERERTRIGSADTPLMNVN